MHIYNIKINGGKALKIIIILLSLFMLMVFLFSIYKIFFSSGKFFVKDRIEQNEIKEINYNGEEYEASEQNITLIKGEIDTEKSYRVEFEKDQDTGLIYRAVINEK